MKGLVASSGEFADWNQVNTPHLTFPDSGC